MSATNDTPVTLAPGVFRLRRATVAEEAWERLRDTVETFPAADVSPLSMSEAKDIPS